MSGNASISSLTSLIVPRNWMATKYHNISDIWYTLLEIRVFQGVYTTTYLEFLMVF
jgi:hypothetical protein